MPARVTSEDTSFVKRKDNARLNPEGKGHSGGEELPYWFRGFVALGCVLDDPRILEESRPFIENCFASQRPDGYFGTAAQRGDEKRGPDLMPIMSMPHAKGLFTRSPVLRKTRPHQATDIGCEH